MDAYTILLVSRGTMSGGRLIGDCLARHEGIRYLTREDLLDAVNRQGDIATRLAERIERAEASYAEFTELRRPYLILMRLALLEIARRERLAYFGYSGHLLLEPIRHFVRVRLLASVEKRVAMTRERLGYSEAEAREYIRDVDSQRTRWARFVYGRDVRDPSLYDLCLNVERVSREGACQLLRDLTRHPDFEPTAESVRQVENDYLATKVLAALLTNPETSPFEVGARARENVVKLEGPYLEGKDRDSVLAIASAVSGVRSVEYEPGYAPAFRHLD